MRTRFNEELESLNKEMITLGMLCESAIGKATDALMSANTDVLEEMPEILEEVLHIQSKIESKCIRLLMQQQPVAQDLRTISSALKMVTDMERIGTQSYDVAEIIGRGEVRLTATRPYFDNMSAAVTKMVTDSIDSFVKKDLELAKLVIEYDDVVDNCFTPIKQTLIHQLTLSDEESESIIDQLMIAKYFERIGDHAENIARWVYYSITGSQYGEA